MPKIVPELSATTIKNAKAKSKDYSLSDGKGLSLLIKTNSSKLWRYQYSYNGTRGLISLGKYPNVSLAFARQERQKYEKILAEGKNPSLYKKQEKQKKNDLVENTLEKIINKYLDLRKKDLAPRYHKRIEGQLYKDIVPYLGKRIIDSIEHYELLNAIQRVQNRGAVESGIRLLNLCGQVWMFAISNGWAKHNITADIDRNTTLQKPKKGHFNHITDPEQLRELIISIDNYHGDLSTKLALQFSLLVFLRPFNIRHAEWSEIDFDKKLMTIDSSKMKMKIGHIVPLSTKAIEILKEAKKLSWESKYVFPSPLTRARALSENTLNNALKRLGFKDQMTTHGIRHTASTILNENISNHGVSSDIIEKQLAHTDSNSVRAIYNKSLHLEERIRLMQWWSDFLYALKIKHGQYES